MAKWKADAGAIGLPVASYLVLPFVFAALACANAGQADPSGSGGSGAGGTSPRDAGMTATGGTGSGGTGSGTGGTASPDGGAAGAAGGSPGTGGSGGLGGQGPTPTYVTIAGPVIQVDFDMQGRPTTEVTELGYTAWPVVGGTTTITNTLQGITFTLARTGSNGTDLISNWQKVAIDAPNYARLVGDGVTVDGGDAGAQIQMTIHGLSTGTHSIQVYLNQANNVASAAPVDILVNGTVKVTGAVPSVQALSTATAKIVYFTFPAQAGQDVVLLFRAQTSSSAANKNVMINGFDLDVPNVADQASNPTPANGDEHVDCDTGSVTLSWKGAAAASSHDVYVGNDLASVQSATRASPLFRGNQTGTTFPLAGISSLKTYYWRIDEVTSQNVATVGNVWYFRPRHLAFPDAQGYGRFARGGRGGIVVHVTNLNDSGTGSLRDAITTDRGPRVIVFDVAGVIPLASRLAISQNYITVAGQTSPGKGICIRSAPFGATGVSDLVIQHVRVRIGSGPTYDGMGLEGSDNSIVDHASISWSIDEGFSSRTAKNITLQRTMIAECLNDANHTNSAGMVDVLHGFAGSISGDIGSFHHDLLAHCEGRNWSMAGGLDAGGNFAGRLDLFDTVFYNWGGRTNDGGAHQVNFVNNYYKPGAASHVFTAMNLTYDNFPGTQQYYMSGVIMPGHFDESNQAAGQTLAALNAPTTYPVYVTTPFFPSYATVLTAEEAYKDVLSDVGMNQPMFDDHDTRIVKETLAGTFTYSGSLTGKPGLPDSETDVGGFESYPTTNRAANWDSDGDGLPDWWERQHGTNPTSATGDFSDTNGDPDGDGYTNLDDYLQWMAKPHFFTTPGASVTIDLAKTFAGYTSGASYSSSAAMNGTVTISGTTATFKAGACGLASWTLTVKDSAGSTMTRSMVAFIDIGGGAACP